MEACAEREVVWWRRGECRADILATLRPIASLLPEAAKVGAKVNAFDRERPVPARPQEHCPKVLVLELGRNEPQRVVRWEERAADRARVSHVPIAMSVEEPLLLASILELLPRVFANRI